MKEVINYITKYFKVLLSFTHGPIKNRKNENERNGMELKIPSVLTWFQMKNRKKRREAKKGKKTGWYSGCIA